MLGFYGIIFGISHFARSAFIRSWGGGLDGDILTSMDHVHHIVRLSRDWVRLTGGKPWVLPCFQARYFLYSNSVYFLSFNVTQGIK